jgi:DNA-binding NarL/FixJ family response regulator
MAGAGDAARRAGGDVTRILVADDQALVRSGIRTLLEAHPGFEVVGEAANGGEALAVARSRRPDVVLMDVRMSEMDGIEATRQLTSDPEPPRVVMLTTFDLDEYVYEAMRAGASGFLLKDATREQLLGGIEAITAGESLLAPAITRRLVERFVRQPPPGLGMPESLTGLTEREAEVLRLVARGLANGEIALRLFISQETVKTHVSHILKKLGLHDRVQAVVVAYESGLVQAGS